MSVCSKVILHFSIYLSFSLLSLSLCFKVVNTVRLILLYSVKCWTT